MLPSDTGLVVARTAPTRRNEQQRQQQQRVDRMLQHQQWMQALSPQMAPALPSPLQCLTTTNHACAGVTGAVSAVALLLKIRRTRNSPQLTIMSAPIPKHTVKQQQTPGVAQLLQAADRWTSRWSQVLRPCSCSHDSHMLACCLQPLTTRPRPSGLTAQ